MEPPATAPIAAVPIRPQPWMIAVVLATMAGALVILYVFDPSSSGVYPPCMFHKLTGLHCPGCGGTRAVHSLLHGDVRQALAWNALVPALIAGLVVLWGFYAGQYLFKGRRNFPPLPSRWARLIFIGLLIFWVARNLPFAPFTVLAPHELSRTPATLYSQPRSDSRY
ncbi:MAG: DUF2752 domain-containing protein [Candidatus Sumerlaeia bacterium]